MPFLTPSGLPISDPGVWKHQTGYYFREGDLDRFKYYRLIFSHQATTTYSEISEAVECQSLLKILAWPNAKFNDINFNYFHPRLCLSSSDGRWVKVVVHFFKDVFIFCSIYAPTYVHARNIFYNSLKSAGILIVCITMKIHGLHDASSLTVQSARTNYQLFDSFRIIFMNFFTLSSIGYVSYRLHLPFTNFKRVPDKLVTIVFALLGSHCILLTASWTDLKTTPGEVVLYGWGWAKDLSLNVKIKGVISIKWRRCHHGQISSKVTFGRREVC